MFTSSSAPRAGPPVVDASGRPTASMPSDQIQNIFMHYLSDQVEIDVILPLDYGCDRHHSLAQQLKQKALTLDYVGKINIYYAP